MRTLEEISADVKNALSFLDGSTLTSLADELDELNTVQAMAWAARARAAASAFTGDYPSALENLRRSLEAHEELGDRLGVAMVTSNMGLVYADTETTHSALEYYDRSLKVHEEIDHLSGVALVTGNKGIVFAENGEHDSALEHYNLALEIHEQLGDVSGVARVTSNMGLVYADTGDYTSALEYHRRALEMHEEMGNNTGIVRDLGNIIATLILVKDHDQAAELLDRQSAMNIDDPGIRAGQFINRGRLALASSDTNTAREHFSRALAISDAAGVRSMSATCHSTLRDLALQENDLPTYVEHNNEHQRITEELRGKQATQRIAMLEAEKKMEAVERERERERAILYSTLPKDVAERMVRGEDVSDHFDNAVVLFLDVAQFTRHSSSMHPSDVISFLEEIYRAFDLLCQEHGVVKVKTIGDSYLCFKGDGTASENAGSVGRVALAMINHSATWPDGEPP